MSTFDPTAFGAADVAAAIPRDGQGPVFREPWEAQAFAIMRSLCEQGKFSAAEWSATLGEEIRRGDAAGVPESFYLSLLSALEHIVVAKGLTTRAALKRCRDEWDAAARCTPHGQPIELARGSAQSRAG